MAREHSKIEFIREILETKRKHSSDISEEVLGELFNILYELDEDVLEETLKQIKIKCQNKLK